MSKFGKISFFILLTLQINIYAQQLGDSTHFDPSFFRNNYFSLGLDKQLNTYLFNNFLKYGITGSNYFIGARELFNTTIINSSVKNIKDEHNFLITGGYSFTDNLSAGISIKNYIFADDRSLQISKTSLLNSVLFVNYKPIPQLSFFPYLGLSSNKQQDLTDKGYIYGADMYVSSLMISDFELNSLLKFQNEDISPRKNMLRNIGLRLVNSFNDNFLNKISALFYQQRRDFYFEADAATALQYGIVDNIQSRTETSYYIQDSLWSIRTSSGINGDVSGAIYWRTIDRNTRYITTQNAGTPNYDTQINELKIDLNGGLNYRSDDLYVLFRYSFAQYEEKHNAKKIDNIDYNIFSGWDKQEYRKNNLAETSSLSLSTVWSISPHDNIIMSLYHRKLRYDTPSSENYDDRDELLSIARIGYEKTFNPSFKMNFYLDGSLNKIVYIYAERSSNNNLRRFIKFSASGLYETSLFTTLNSAEVSANYTTYDFEYLNPGLQSYSFRQFIFRDSSSANLTHRVKLQLNGYIKLSEQGNFYYDSFTERPARRLDERLIETRLILTASPLYLSFGVRYFNLDVYNINGTNERVLSTTYKSIGPVSEIKYNIGSKIDIRFFGWYEFITGSGSAREVPNVILKINWALS